MFEVVRSLLWIGPTYWKNRLDDLDTREKRCKKNDDNKFLDIHGEPVKENKLVFMLAIVIFSLVAIVLIWCTLSQWR